jgi:hypothetical protein
MTDEKAATEKKAWTRKEVEALLDQQKADCADVIQRNNLSEYNAKQKILNADRVKF